jgi:hypothetical protein
VSKNASGIFCADTECSGADGFIWTDSNLALLSDAHLCTVPAPKVVDGSNA